MYEPHANTARELGSTATLLFAKVLAGHTDCALIDYPDHANVGDSAIWLGESLVLQRLGLRIRYVASTKSFSEAVLRRMLPTGTILLHGGGNFGTVWPSAQEHREMVMSRFRDYPIIQLPQSISFDDEFAVVRARNLVEAHPNFILMARDRPSLEFGTTELGARTILCPDSAFLLEAHQYREPPVVDVLVLARSDKERVVDGWEESLRTSGLSFEIADWVDEGTTLAHWLSSRLWPRAFGRLTKVPGFFDLLKSAWDATASARMRRGCALLSRGRVVITDRLHAHILCTLLGIPHVALDNTYGKVGNFIDAWTNKSSLLVRARTSAEAASLAGALLTRRDSSTALAEHPKG